ncbi:hypothetical protein Q5H91_12405 [Sphingomonas sp. KR1UV-12]|uniref:Uncharacterized protein n=1 Tax=Sphingomonas aurea TaxID=3063994 RepID=A0ABT9EM27_9SPHN|nr:hypothetical protein [Sphingomonas sp. KR1UV-12]MDP1028017.1 hypothetical protein [Sphingomonas sp. KR1UV-12]
MFRTDRLGDVTFLDERYPERRAVLRRRWLAMMAEHRATVEGIAGAPSTG